MGTSKDEQRSNSKPGGDESISKGSCSVQNTPSKTDIDPRLDFSSEFFDPQVFLEADDITLPYPNVRPYNNLSEYNSVMFNKGKRARNNANKSADNYSCSTTAQNSSQPSDSQKSNHSQELFVGAKEQLPSRKIKNKCKESDENSYRRVKNNYSGSTMTQNGSRQYDSQKTNYSQELFDDEEEQPLTSKVKNKYRESDEYYDQQRNMKPTKSFISDRTSIRRNEFYSDVEDPPQRTNEDKIEKLGKTYHEVSPQENRRCGFSQNERRKSLNCTKTRTGRKEYHSDVGEPTQTKEGEVEKWGKNYSEVSPQESGRYGFGQNEKKSPKFIKEQEKCRYSSSHSKFNSSTPDSAELHENYGRDKTNFISGNTIPKMTASDGSPSEKKKSNNFNEQQKIPPGSVSKEKFCATKPGLQKHVAEGSGGSKKQNNGDPTPKNPASGNRSHNLPEKRKLTFSDYQEKCRHLASQNKLCGMTPNLRETVAGTTEVETCNESYSGILRCDNATTKSKSCYEKEKFENSSEQQEQCVRSVSKDRHNSPEVDSTERQESSEGANESEIENFRINSSGDTSTMTSNKTRGLIQQHSSIRSNKTRGLIQETSENEIENFRVNSSSDNCTMSLTTETVDLQFSQEGNKKSKNKSNDFSNGEKKIENTNACKGKPSPIASEPTKLPGLIQENRKAEMHNKTCSDTLGKNQSSKDHGECSHDGKRNSADSQERLNYSGSREEFHVDKLNSSEPQETDNRAVENESEKCSSSSPSKNSSQNSYKHGHYERKTENCGRDDKRDADRTSGGACYSQKQDSAELQVGKQTCQEVKEKEHDHKTVRNHEMANENESEKLKHYKIPKIKNKVDKRKSVMESVDAISESNKNSEVVNYRKRQNKALNVIESRNIEENHLSEDVSHSREQSFVKNQTDNYTKDKVPRMNAEKSENLKSLRHLRAAVKNSKRNTEQCQAHHKEKSNMNITAETHGVSSNSVHHENNRKCIDDRMLPAKDCVKRQENQHYPSRYREGRHHYPSKCGGEHHHSLELDENAHCHSESEGNLCDRSKTGNNHHSRSDSGDRCVHPKSHGNCRDHSSHGCSQNHENCCNHSRGHGNCCDHSRSDESFHNRSRHDRRYDERMKYNRYDRDHFRYGERYRYRSKRGRYDRSFHSQLEYNKYHHDHPRYSRNRRDQFRHGRGHQDDLEHPDFHRGTHDRRRSWERHESDDEKLSGHREMKEQMFNDSERCHSKHDKGRTNAETRKIQKPENKVDEGKNENNNLNVCKRKRRIDYEDGELFSGSDSGDLTETEVVNFPREDQNREKHDKITNNVRGDNFTQRSNQNHYKKWRDYENNEAQVRNGSKLGEVSSELPSHRDAHGQDHIERRFISERTDKRNKTPPYSHNKGKGEISNECGKNDIQEKQSDDNVSYIRNVSTGKNSSVEKSLKQGSRKRQANLFDYKGFTIKSVSKTSVMQESCNTVRCGNETPAVSVNAAHKSDSDISDLTYHFDKLECRSSERMFLESTPNELPPHDVINWSENRDSSYPIGMSHEDGEQCDRNNEFKEASCQNRSLEENGKKNSELKIQCSSGSDDENVEVGGNQEHCSDSDSFENFCYERNEERNLEENYDIPHGELEKQHWEVGQPLKNDEGKNRRDLSGISNYDLFGTSSDDDDSVDEADKMPEETQNNLNAEFQNHNSRNSCISDLFGSISESDSADEAEKMQILKEDLEWRCSSPDKNVQNSHEGNNAENRQSLSKTLLSVAEPFENLGNEENDAESFHSVNPDSGDDFSDEDVENSAGKYETTENQNRNFEECSENRNGELQSKSGEDNARNVENKECLQNCEVEINKSLGNEFCDLESAPERELPNCADESLCQNKNLGKNCASEDATLSALHIMEGIKNSEKGRDQCQLPINHVHGDSYAFEVEDCEENLSVRKSVSSDAKQKEARESIYQSIRLLKQNAPDDCACKCHKDCGATEKNSKGVGIIRTYCDKSTQVNFDADEDYEDHANINIIQVKITLSGDRAFAEDYKKSALHENMNTFLVKCNEDRLKKPSFVEDKENTEAEEECLRPEVPLEVSKGKRRRKRRGCTKTADVVQEGRSKRRRTKALVS